MCLLFYRLRAVLHGARARTHAESPGQCVLPKVDP